MQIKMETVSHRKTTQMKFVQSWWYKLFGLFVLCLLTIIGITACDINTNTTPQNCDGVVNVNSCTSNNKDGIQTTVIAEAQANNVKVQATAQANVDATVTAVIPVQQAAAKDEGIVSLGDIIVPIALFISIIAFFCSFSDDQDSVTVKVASGILAVLLIFMQIIIIRGV